MKKMFALMLAAMMLLAMMPAAMAYDAAVLPGETTVDYSMTLNLQNATKLPYDITYTFAAENPTVFQPTGINQDQIAQAVTGVPTLSAVAFTTNDTFVNKVCKKTLTINWQNVTIKEPGIYVWEINKSVDFKGPEADKANQPSNNNATFYLFAYVIEDKGTLKLEQVKLTTDAALSKKFTEFGDTYPATSLSLSLTKYVQGNQGSKNQYFKYTIMLKSPTTTTIDYGTISGHDATVPATFYNEGGTNATTTIDANGNKVITLWLKHGQTATIDGLLFNTTYTIIEDTAGYSVTNIEVLGDTNADTNKDTATVSDTALTTNTNVAYTNEKNATVPTGIELETAAPIVGMILAMAMLALLFVGKRKEEIA